MQTGTRGSTTWLFWERREYSGLAPPFCELGKGHMENGMRETLCPRRAPRQWCWAGEERDSRVYWTYLAVEFCLQSSAAACTAARSCFTQLQDLTSVLVLSWGSCWSLLPAVQVSLSGSSALARVSHSLLVSLVSAAGLMRVHTVSTLASPTKILNCLNRSLRNSAYKSLQIEYEPYKLKKQGNFSPTY